MCGIFMYLKNVGFTESDKKFISETIELLRARGPDAESHHSKQFIRDDVTWFFELFGATLWTQGSRPTRQPVVNDEGSFLLWNGDVYSGLEGLGEPSQSDTTLVFELLTSEQGGVRHLTQLTGPYSFVFFDAVAGRLWFGRDPVGRTSLLYKIADNTIVLASTAWDGSLIEVPPRGFWSVDLSKDLDIRFHPWSHLRETGLSEVGLFNVADSLQHCVLSSCGDYAWLNEEPKPFKEHSGSTDSIMSELLSDKTLSDHVPTLKRLLSHSVETRAFVPSSDDRGNPPAPSLAILFSGGLDSTLLALFAHNHVPLGQTIDLLNVAFENPKVDFDHVPDRRTGEASLEELKGVTPGRTWNFVKIDVSLNELNQKRGEIIQKLIHPLKTVLDDSLGCALWFASRGIGSVNGQSYQSKARVIFSGIGADELFGGYSRHRRCPNYATLGRCLRDEVRNIGVRNLGRDNRVVSHHARQLRTPFLDEALIAWADSLPPWVRCRPLDLPPGLGDKTLLRLLAATLGLKATAKLPKKAMQFGTKIAISKERGNANCDRLL